MLHSMTAFISHSFNVPGYTLSWDIRSVNHRYLDLVIKLPDILQADEMSVRNTLKSKLLRGKVECALRVKPDPQSEQTAVHVNASMVQGLMTAAKTLESEADDRVDGRLRAMDILRWPGVVMADSEHLTAHKETILAALQPALEAFVQQRAQEGEAMAAFILTKLDELNHAVAGIEQAFPALLTYQEEKLRSRLADLQEVSIDNQRLEQELVYLLQRLDIEEELSRLKTHVAKVKETIETVKAGGSVGKMLDFYMQELNREANTICSKSQNAQITQEGVDLKMTIEQMREQVQNIQ